MLSAAERFIEQEGGCDGILMQLRNVMMGIAVLSGQAVNDIDRMLKGVGRHTEIAGEGMIDKQNEPETYRNNGR